MNNEMTAGTEVAKPVSGLVSGDRYLSMPDLKVNAARAASALHSVGVWRGDTIALLLRNDFAFFEATQGAAALGATTVPLNWHMTANEIAYVLEDCDAKVVIGHADLLSESVLTVCNGREVIAVETSPEILEAYQISSTLRHAPGAIPEWYSWIGAHKAWSEPTMTPTSPMFYTSGTSGMPKGVRRQAVSPEVAQRAAARSAEAWGLTGSGVISIMTGPLYHSAPNAYGMTVLRKGGLLILQPRFDPKRMLGLIEAYQVTHLHMVPTMFVRLLGAQQDSGPPFSAESLQYVVHGAAPCPESVKAQMIDWWGPIIHEYYAMTETGIITTSDSESWLNHRGTVGRAVDGVEVRIMGDDGAFVASGTAGQICVRSETTPFVSYHRASEKTEALRHGDYILTGDIGYLNEQGFLFILDRMSDMVISGGVNIYPFEIERAMMAMPEINDCAVFGVPDPEYGEKLVACIDSTAELDAADITSDLGQHLAKYKIPREFYFDIPLPREDSGKIKKRLLRDTFIQQTHRASGDDGRF